MPIYSHEVSSGLRRTVTALPVFGSAATNTVVLGSAIVLVVVAITLLFGPNPDDGRGAAARRAVRCIVYALPVVLVLLYVYGGSIAATVEGGAAPQLAALMSGPAHEVRPRIDYATGMPMSAPDMPPPVAPLAPMPAVNSAETTVSARLAQIENSLQRS